MRKIGLFGGTFDPIHNGHIRVAELARERAGLDTVLFIPAGDPPHKAGKPVTEKSLRYRMAELAIAGRPEFALSDYEIKLGEPGYSVETAEYFRAVLPGDRLFFIIGADSFADMPTWWHYRELMDLVDFIVVDRPGTDKSAYLSRFAGDETPPRVFLIEGANMDISSTMIREKIKNGEPADGLAPKAVLAFIKEQGLYQSRDTKENE